MSPSGDQHSEVWETQEGMSNGAEPENARVMVTVLQRSLQRALVITSLAKVYTSYWPGRSGASKTL